MLADTSYYSRSWVGDEMRSQIDSDARTAPRFMTGDPHEFEERIGPFGGDGGEFTVTPLRRGQFSAELAPAMLNRIRLGRAKFNSFRLSLAPTRDYSSFVMPLVRGIETAVPGRMDEIAPGAAIFSRGDQPCEYRVHHDAVFVANVSADSLRTAARRLTRSSGTPALPANCQLSSLEPVSAAFLRSATSLWTAATQNSAQFQSTVAQDEREEELLEMLALTLTANQRASVRIDSAQYAASGLRRAVEWISAYLKDPITRADLCDVAGLNARTLTRAFARKYGVSPIAFVRARRLDAIHRLLLAAEPGEVSVTKIAFDYGFSQLGRFAADYRRAFGELPSATLRS